jgi:hypothetical protein
MGALYKIPIQDGKHPPPRGAVWAYGFFHMANGCKILILKRCGSVSTHFFVLEFNQTYTQMNGRGSYASSSLSAQLGAQWHKYQAICMGKVCLPAPIHEIRWGLSH